MMSVRLRSGLFVIGAAIAGLSACGGAGSGGPGMSQSLTAGALPMSRPAHPTPSPTPRNLLYITVNYPAKNAWVYTYPPGAVKRVGTLPGVYGYNQSGPCTGPKGDIFIPTGFASKAEILMFAHGGTTPIRTLKGVNYPEDCAVDPTTGNLAVTEYNGIIQIFAKAKGTPKQYSYGVAGYETDVLNATYDSSGNLYVDAELLAQEKSKVNQFTVGELPAGGSKFETVWYPEGSTSGKGFPGGLQWDGSHLVVGDSSTCAVYIMGGTPSKLTLKGCNGVLQFWVLGDRLVGANTNAAKETVMFWPYPAGGKAKYTIRGLQYAYGVTVSLGTPK